MRGRRDSLVSLVLLLVLWGGGGACQVHAHIISTLRAKMPSMFGADAAKAELLATLPALFQSIARERGLTWGDFPSPTL
jgi:hypothetical protein